MRSSFKLFVSFLAPDHGRALLPFRKDKGYSTWYDSKASSVTSDYLIGNCKSWTFGNVYWYGTTAFEMVLIVHWYKSSTQAGIQTPRWHQFSVSWSYLASRGVHHFPKCFDVLLDQTEKWVTKPTALTVELKPECLFKGWITSSDIWTVCSSVERSPESLEYNDFGG